MSIAPRPLETGRANSDGSFSSESFVKRLPASWRYSSAGIERRQFPNVGVKLSEEAEELGEAVDRFKQQHSIRQINFEDLLGVIKACGYSR